MEQSELLGELLEGLTRDVKALQTKVGQLPTTTPPDYRESLQALAKSVQELQGKAPTQAPASTVDLNPVLSRLERMEQQIRQRPEYTMSQYVRYGAYAFGLMVVLLVGVTWLALSWRSEREDYAQAYAHDNWRVRYTKQADPDYYNFMEAKFKEPGLTQWVVEQEAADEKRELAREAAEQAKSLTQEANQLEGKPMTKGKKK
ncbi:hypothetical protein [Spirosoma sp.]|uniref:hypothetical protein n=1 Tax=Spirosoma sp. TaxID=1899569 RepID=UPI002626657A|nr:hypothetical protein [Spirosoma sp.]MCX6214885.1 hypothetical protein [Spirosoma sp.]